MLLALSISQSLAGEIKSGLSDKEKESPLIQWGTESQEMQVSISVKDETKKFTTNEPIALIVRFKNLSTNACYIPVRRVFSENDHFLFSIIAPSGKDISPVFHRVYYAGSGINVCVPPKQVEGFEFDLNDICEMDETGTYKIILKVKKRVSGSNKLAEVVSNRLYVSILPAQK